MTGNVTVITPSPVSCQEHFWIFSTSHNCFLIARATTQKRMLFLVYLLLYLYLAKLR